MAWYVTQKRTSMQARSSISRAIASARAVQGVEDKEEARREIKVSTSGQYIGVDAFAYTIHIYKAQIQWSSLLFSQHMMFVVDDLKFKLHNHEIKLGIMTIL